MNFKLDADQLKKGGKIALRIGKAIVIEGVKGLALKTATAGITSAFEGKSVRDITLDTVLGEEKKKDTSVKLLSEGEKGDKIEEIIEEIGDAVIIKDEGKDSSKIK